MRLLWVSNSPIGPASRVLEREYHGSSGGWIQSEYEGLIGENIGRNEFYFLTTLPEIGKNEILYKKNEIGEIYCVHSPKVSYGIEVSKKMQVSIQNIIDKIQPDIIQIWGTETWISYAVSKCKTKAPKIIFIQGLIGVHQRYKGGYFGRNKDEKDYIMRISILEKLKNFIKNINFSKQVDIEKKTIKNCKNVIVDSDFAKAYCMSVSDDICCYQHVLLPNRVFYSKKWDINNCKRYSIFTVYGSSAEKGTQNLIKAASILKKKYPNIKIIIPGNYEIDSLGKLLPIGSNIFQTVIYKMIKKYSLDKNIVFTGKLSAEEMAENIVKSHIFVNPSCMEVHALSLREAIIEGVPCITSLCGSTGEYIKHKINGFVYRYEEYETLAYYIDKIFSDDKLAEKISSNTVDTFDELKSESNSLEEIYVNMLKNNKKS